MENKEIKITKNRINGYQENKRNPIFTTTKENQRFNKTKKRDSR